MKIIPDHQRSYITSHQFVFWSSLGLAATGLINIVFPSAAVESSAAIVLSPTIRFLFNASWFIGGVLAAIGLIRGKPKVEGAGMSIIAAALATLFMVVFSIRPDLALSNTAFIIAMAIGAAARARYLMTHVYVNLSVARDQRGIK